MALNDYYTLGSSGLRVSSLALGTMTFDDGSLGSRPEDSFAILDRYLGLGGNFIDTANFYGGGQSEETLGAYFTANPGKRERVVLATKFCMSLIPDDPNAGGAGRKAIIAQLDRSLLRLKTDYADLYWQHMWDRHTPIEETLSTLNDLVRAGKVRNIGMSNVPAWFVGEAVAIARLRGWEPIAALQVQYSLLTRTVEGEQFGAARAFGLGIVPWSPLANGTLSGKYSRERTSDPASSRAKYAKLDAATFAALDLLERIASTLGVTVAQVALAWVRQQPRVTSTLIGARTIDQLETNLASIDVDLDDAVVAELNAPHQAGSRLPVECAAPRRRYPARKLHHQRRVGRAVRPTEVTPYFVVKSALSPCFVTASRMSASGHFRPIYRSCLTVHVRFDSKATDWPVVGHLTSFMSTRPNQADGTGSSVYIYGANNIPSGSQTISINYVSAALGCDTQGASITVTGSSLSTAFETPASTSGASGTSSSVTATSQSNELVVDIIGDHPGGSPGGSQTQRRGTS